jgi:RimJ/RimL family protein N-acetyltransferase
MKSFPQLETERLHLVHIKHQYKRNYFEIMSMDKVTAYYGMESLENIEQAATIINSFHDLYAQKRAIRWGIILKETNKFIGTIGLHHLYEASKKAEIGFELHPDHWRRGIATEAISEVLNYSFGKMGLYRIGAITFPENNSSIQLLKKIGFQHEGSLRGYLYQYNESHDANIYSLLKPEWERANKKEYEIDDRLEYRDHMSEIVKKAGIKGDF